MASYQRHTHPGGAAAWGSKSSQSENTQGYHWAHLD